MPWCEPFDFNPVSATRFEAYDLDKELLAIVSFGEKENTWACAIYDGLKVQRDDGTDKALFAVAKFSRYECENACNEFLRQYERNS